MLKKISLLVLLTLLFACSDSSDSDQASDRKPDSNSCDLLGLKVINGSSCGNPSSAVVRLIYLSSNGSGFACTGSMISANKVLTAAHCIYSSIETLSTIPANSIRVSTDTAGSTLAFSKQIDIHPQFEAQLLNLSKSENFKSSASDFADQLLDDGFADVAVITLDRNLNLPTLPILTSNAAESGTIISIYGYGLTSPGGSSPSASLISGEMELERSGVSNFTAIFGEDGSNTCQGDSGGPALVSPQDSALVQEVAIAGITSLGFGSSSSTSCSQGEISVFTATTGSRVSDFIKSKAPAARFL